MREAGDHTGGGDGREQSNWAREKGVKAKLERGLKKGKGQRRRNEAPMEHLFSGPVQEVPGLRATLTAKLEVPLAWNWTNMQKGAREPHALSRELGDLVQPSCIS